MMDVRLAYVRSPFTACVTLMKAGFPATFDRSNALSSSGVNCFPRHEVSSAYSVDFSLSERPTVRLMTAGRSFVSPSFVISTRMLGIWKRSTTVRFGAN